MPQKGLAGLGHGMQNATDKACQPEKCYTPQKRQMDKYYAEGHRKDSPALETSAERHRNKGDVPQQLTRLTKHKALHGEPYVQADLRPYVNASLTACMMRAALGVAVITEHS